MSYFKSLLFSVLFLSTSVVFGQALTAKEIIKKSEDKIRGGNQAYTEMTIEIIRPKWSREMKLKSWALGVDYSMILITGPARDKGSVFLKNQKQVWGYN